MKKFLARELPPVLLIFLTASLSLYFSSQSLLSASLRLDESQSLWVATQSVPSLLTWVSEDVHVPLYHLLLHWWVGVFGLTEVAARSLSLLFFILTIPALYLLGRKIANTRIATTAVLLYLVSPFMLWYAFETRMYSMFMFITTLQTLSFVVLLKHHFHRYWIPYLLCSVVGLYTHYFFALVLITQWFYVAGNSFLNTLQTKKLSDLKPAAILSLLQLLSVASLYPWLSIVLTAGTASHTKPLIPPPSSFTVFQTFSQILFGFQDYSLLNVIISLWPLLLVFIFLIFTKHPRHQMLASGYLMLMLWFPLSLAFIASIYRPLFLTRYFVLMTPTILLFIAWFIHSFRRTPSTILAIIIFGVFSTTAYIQNTQQDTPVKEDYRAVTEILNTQASPHDLIMVSAPFTIYPIEYYYSGASTIHTVPSWDRYNGGTIQPFDPDEFVTNFESIRAQYHNVYIVTSYDQGYETELTDYFENHYLRLDYQQPSEGITIATYKLRY
jgi:mannosyltransferase